MTVVDPQSGPWTVVQLMDADPQPPCVNCGGQTFVALLDIGLRDESGSVLYMAGQRRCIGCGDDG